MGGMVMQDDAVATYDSTINQLTEGQKYLFEQ
jgi:hypothetical protein